MEDDAEVPASEIVQTEKIPVASVDDPALPVGFIPNCLIFGRAQFQAFYRNSVDSSEPQTGAMCMSSARTTSIAYRRQACKSAFSRSG